MHTWHVWLVVTGTIILWLSMKSWEWSSSQLTNSIIFRGVGWNHQPAIVAFLAFFCPLERWMAMNGGPLKDFQAINDWLTSPCYIAYPWHPFSKLEWFTVKSYICVSILGFKGPYDSIVKPALLMDNVGHTFWPQLIQRGNEGKHHGNTPIWLVVWNCFYDFPDIGNNHPNWQTPWFFRGVAEG